MLKTSRAAPRCGSTTRCRGGSTCPPFLCIYPPVYFCCPLGRGTLGSPLQGFPLWGMEESVFCKGRRQVGFTNRKHHMPPRFNYWICSFPHRGDRFSAVLFRARREDEDPGFPRSRLEDVALAWHEIERVPPTGASVRAAGAILGCDLVVGNSVETGKGLGHGHARVERESNPIVSVYDGD